MKRYLAMTLIGLIVLLIPGSQTLTRASGRDETQAAEKIKARIAKLGVGEKARAQITLGNGQKIKGYVTSAGDDNFTFTERDSGQTKTVAYADVIEVKKPGLSKGAKIGIGVGIGAGVTAVVFGLAVRHALNNLKF
jgi:hypothetical protein